MKRRRRRGERFSDESVDPMNYVSNLSDAMLVLAVGMMLALIVHWNVDISTGGRSSENVGETVAAEGQGGQSAIDRDNALSFTPEELEQMDSTEGETDEGMEKLGEVYYDAETGHVDDFDARLMSALKESNVQEQALAQTAQVTFAAYFRGHYDELAPLGIFRYGARWTIRLTDGDLFPPGTVTLGGLKVFGEESGKVISYAATMAHASESGLSRLFDNLLASDGGFREQVEDVDFYEEGGVGGRIHGETVLFGTAGFMRKRGVNLPRNLGLKTGVFLSVDGTLIAVFAVKYMPAENVDWALHALHHSRITPVLAVRDGNITPALLKRKFGTDARAVYPKLSTRLALSERGGGRPYALLMREGLMPYAEVVLGSKRLCASARRCTVLAFLAATASTLLAFYLTFVGAYSVLTPFSLLIYVLLWSLSALVDALLSDRY